MWLPSPAHLSDSAGPIVSVVLGKLLITRIPWLTFLACLHTVHGTAERKGEGSSHLTKWLLWARHCARCFPTTTVLVLNIDLPLPRGRPREVRPFVQDHTVRKRQSQN